MKHILFITLIITFLGCKKDVNTNIPEQTVLVPTLASLTVKYAPPVQTFQFKNDVGTIITGIRGTQIEISPNTYGTSTSDVKIELREVYTKKEMLGSGVYTNSANGMLESLGMFEVQATINGVPVYPEKESIVKINNPGNATPQNTKVFKYVSVVDSITKQEQTAWVEYDSNWDIDSADLSKCKFNFKLITWCSLDKYVASGVNTQINLNLPIGFGSSNTQVFFNLTGVNGLTTLYTEPINNLFFTRPLKIGLSGKLILLAVKDNIYYKKVLNVTFLGLVQNTIIYEMDLSNQAEIESILATF